MASLKSWSGYALDGRIKRVLDLNKNRMDYSIESNSVRWSFFRKFALKLIVFVVSCNALSMTSLKSLEF